VLDKAATSVDQYMVGVEEDVVSVAGFDGDRFLYGDPEGASRTEAGFRAQGAGLLGC